MKIAICLYGQPRDYKHGYDCITNLIRANNENTYDIFFHCWIGDENTKYECSPWRTIDEKSLFIGNTTYLKNDILQLYNPITYLYENPLDKNSDTILMEIEYIKESISYVNSCTPTKNNIYNTLSQIYSRNKVKDLFENYITNTNTTYDMVISTRFDGHDFPMNINISKYAATNKIYTSPMHRPRAIIADNFLIIPPEIYINWFDLYKNIKNIINNTEIELKLNNIHETLIFNMEELLLSNYLFCGYDLNNIEYIL